jgi:hypothetical protein
MTTPQLDAIALDYRRSLLTFILMQGEGRPSVLFFA